MDFEKTVTIMAIGETGVGKSENGNALLMKNAFEANSSPDSWTFKTSSENNIINKICYNYIDTQGLYSSDSLDEHYIQQMVDFLHNWKLGVNAFFLVTNIQNPRFSSSDRNIIQFMNNFFNDSSFWNQTGIIFTRCFKGHFDRKIAEEYYRSAVIKFIKTLPGCQNLDLSMPCFFVDSKKWKTDQSTQMEYKRMREFASSFFPIPTQNLKICTPQIKSCEEEIIEKKLVNVTRKKIGNIEKVTYHYEDLKRKKMTYYNGSVKFTNPTIIKSYTEEQMLDHTPPPCVQPVIVHSSDASECLIF